MNEDELLDLLEMMFDAYRDERQAMNTPNAELRGGPAVSSPERPA